MTPTTIFALASGGGRAGIAVIRVSGPDAAKAAVALTGERDLPARRLVRCRIEGTAGDILDEALVVHFPGPASLTGEDVIELHVHGGRAVVGDTLQALAACPGLRPAAPGEFTRRAFDNGKLDLTAAEGLGDLVQAETSAQRRQALRQMQGDLAALYDGWRRRLLAALAHLEAHIDFADEDLPDAIEDRVTAEVAKLTGEIERHLGDDRRGERIRDGVRVAILGPVNAGKSTLLNRLARREAAIVSSEPGTTRDVIDVHLDLDGYAVVVSDTAGLRAAEGDVEAEGVRRSRHAAETADLRLVVFDGAVWPEFDAEAAGLLHRDAVAVINKSDLGRVRPPVDVMGHPVLAVSALTDDGLGSLSRALEQEVARRFDADEAPQLTRIRHRRALEACLSSLQGSVQASSAELAAEELRLATRALGRITGRVDVEDVLDVIFRDFCIGK